VARLGSIAPRRPAVSRRALRWATIAGAALAGFVSVSFALAGFNSPATGGPQSISSKRIFPGARTVAPLDVRDASAGSESNKSDPLSYADGTTFQPSTAIGSGTNRYLEFTMNSARPGGISVSSAQFNFRLASNNGGGSACFWFDVRSGASVIGTHGSYASQVGCSASTTQTTFNTALPEITSTDQLNGVVIRVYLWETATKKVNVDLATVTGSTPYMNFTSYETQFVDDTSGTPATTVWPLFAVDATTYTATTNWPAAAITTKYLKATFDPSVPAGSVVTSATLTNVWRASANVTNSGTLCYYLEAFNGATSLATHGSGSSAVSCNNSGTNLVTDTVSLPEVNDATKASNLVIKLYYWVSPTCGGAGNPACVKSVTDQVQVAFNYYLN
jgi:hypothetical protein